MVLDKAEAVHTAKIVDYLIFAATKRETCDFIPTVVEDTWVYELWESVMLYTAVATSKLIDHLQTLCGGLHALDVLALQNEIQHYHMYMECIPECINTLEYTQKQSKRAANPIMADTLILIASNTILFSERYPRSEEICEDLTKSKKDWSAWKNMCKASDQNPKVKKQAVVGHYQFGAAHGALRHALQVAPQVQ